MSAPYELQRFVEAQEPVYPQVLAELRAGLKSSHWMWFIFPQILGLGRSPTAVKFAIGSLSEAQAYLRHELLGGRLRECTTIVNRLEGHSVQQIFGYPDDMKFRSSMTLFSNATTDNELFLAALKKYFDGIPDPLTLSILESAVL